MAYFGTIPEMYDHHLTDCYNHFIWIFKFELLYMFHLSNENPGHGYLDKTLHRSLTDHIAQLIDFHLVYACILLPRLPTGLRAHFFKI